MSGLKFTLKPVEGKGSTRQARLDLEKVESEVEGEEFKTERVMTFEGKRFIESPRFLFARINEISVGERGSDRPPKKRR